MDACTWSVLLQRSASVCEVLLSCRPISRVRLGIRTINRFTFFLLLIHQEISCSLHHVHNIKLRTLKDLPCGWPISRSNVHAIPYIADQLQLTICRPTIASSLDFFFIAR